MRAVGFALGLPLSAGLGPPLRAGPGVVLGDELEAEVASRPEEGVRESADARFEFDAAPVVDIEVQRFAGVPVHGDLHSVQSRLHGKFHDAAHADASCSDTVDPDVEPTSRK
jgi:hypothetical protein